MFSSKYLQVISISVFSSLINFSPVYASTQVENIDSLLNYVTKEGEFNGNVLIVDKGKIIYNKSFGYSDISNSKKLNSDSIFELASVSKQFTAMAIAILKERNQLSYEDKLNKFFPQLLYSDITVRQLINHTSGLPDYMELVEKYWDKSKIAKNDDVINLFIKYKPDITFKPGEKYEYSNTGYMLLASIIEKVSGISYKSFLQKNIFEKLGMAHSTVYHRRISDEKIMNYAYGYIFSYSDYKYHLPDDLSNTKFVIYMDGIEGDGAVNSTINDLYLWDRALYTSKLVSKKTIDEIFTSGKLNNNEETDYGFGWGIIKSSPYGKVVYHGGKWPGYTNYISRYIDEDKTIIFLKNKDSRVQGIVTAVENIIHNKSFSLPYIYKNKTAIIPPIKMFDKYIGEYILDENVKILITKSGNKLFSQVIGQESIEIYPETISRYFNNSVGFEINFVENSGGKIDEIILKQDDKDYKLKRTK